MAKEPRKSRSNMTIDQKIVQAVAILKKYGYSDDEIAKIINAAFYKEGVDGT